MAGKESVVRCGQGETIEQRLVGGNGFGRLQALTIAASENIRCDHQLITTQRRPASHLVPCANRSRGLIRQAFAFMVLIFTFELFVADENTGLDGPCARWKFKPGAGGREDGLGILQEVGGLDRVRG